MKNYFLTLCVCVFSTFSYGQVLYSDNFDEEIIKATTQSGYDLSIVDNKLVVQGNGTAAPYEPVEYSIHDSGTNISVDISSSPKIYVKVKASKPSILRIDLRDAGGYVTNNDPVSNSIRENFWIYEYNLTGKLEDAGWDADGPCDRETEQPCPVDASQIANLTISIDPVAGGFSGSVEIEWISLGESLEPFLPDPPKLRYNQVAYFTGRDKIINAISENDFSPIAYQVFNSSNQEVMSGISAPTAFWSDANEYASVIDVSSLNTEGTYRLVTDIDEITFQINDEGYSKLREDAFRYFYFNRASTEITAELGGVYARPSGIPDTNVLVHSSAVSASRPEGTVLSLPKGWYDAGDYNKYVVNSGISTYTLLAAYEHYEDYYKNITFKIPEEGGDLPDILDEVIWNLDWMISMQDPDDGGVYHKLTAKGFSGRIMPEAYGLQRYVVQKSTSAALNLAAVAATASRIFEEYESVKPGYSAQLLQVAKDAYAWAKANPSIFYSQNSETTPLSPVLDISTGEYGDSNVNDEFQWAAVELFITSNEEQYKDDINISNIGGGVPAWPYVSPLALISIAHHSDALNGQIDVMGANNKLISTADNLKNLVTTSPMRITMDSNAYVWGSNGATANQLFILLSTFELTNDESYLDAAYSGMDYLLGRNATGYSFVSGFGDQPMLYPHHRISDADGVAAPIPGMLAGGPQNENNPDTGDCSSVSSGFPGAYPAISYIDDWCSYSTNEVTINWNAPLVYVVNALHFYENESILSVDEVSVNSDKIGVYPNPTNGLMQMITSENLSGSLIKFYSIQGKEVYTTTLEGASKSVDISDLPTGFYLMEITTDNKTTFTRKIVRK